ncbi:MAG: class I SAM-dependent methyltransferase, partial [Phycisphaerae bacterium]
MDGRTPYPDGHFDSIAITEVIEHVPDEAATLAELDRILKRGGVLVLTTPHRGWLTFLDPGNLKFMFPRLHRFVHLRLIRNRAYFDQRFTRAE